MIEGYGTTINCILMLLIYAKPKKYDKIVILGLDGPILTKVRAIATHIL